jgi:hypothetical protein
MNDGSSPPAPLTGDAAHISSIETNNNPDCKGADDMKSRIHVKTDGSGGKERRCEEENQCSFFP